MLVGYVHSEDNRFPALLGDDEEAGRYFWDTETCTQHRADGSTKHFPTATSLSPEAVRRYIVISSWVEVEDPTTTIQGDGLW